MTQANVLVSAVKRSQDGARIEYLRIHLPVGGFVGPSVIDARRESVVDMIQRERKVVMTVFDEDGTWVDGAIVRVTRRGYLLTDADDLEEDNLGELPEIDRIENRL